MATDQPSGVTDALLGLVWALAGVLLVVAGVLRLVPSPYALGAWTMVAGLLGIMASLIGRPRAGAWAGLVPGSLLTTFGVLVVRFPELAADMLGPLAAAVFLVDGLVRLGSARAYPALGATLVVAGLLSLLMGGLILWDGIDVTTEGVAILLGCGLFVDGVAAALAGRAVATVRRRG